MKSGGALAAKITDIDHQHTPTARLCLPRTIRSKKSEAWFHELKECIRFISKLSSYLGFRWLTPSPLNIDPQNNSMENMIHFLFSVLGGFVRFSKTGGMLSSLSTHSQSLILCLNLTQNFQRKPLLHLKRLLCGSRQRKSCISSSFILQDQRSCL